MKFLTVCFLVSFVLCLSDAHPLFFGMGDDQLHIKTNFDVSGLSSILRDTFELKRKILETLMKKKGFSGTISASIVTVPSPDSPVPSDLPSDSPVSADLSSSVDTDLGGSLEADSVTTGDMIVLEKSETPAETPKEEEAISLDSDEFETLPFAEEPKAEASSADIQIDDSIFQKTPFALPSIDSHTLNFIPHEAPGKLPLS